jgi:broad-specificity NMP kinase
MLYNKRGDVPEKSVLALETMGRKRGWERMIIWISGAYGVGKSTLAEALAGRMGDALVFDAEEVGNAVRGNYPDCPYGYIFEDYPLWGEFCYRLLKDIHDNFQKDILVPMTLVRSASYRIIQALERDGIETFFIVLEASHQSIHDRILARGEEEGCWCMENIEMARSGCAALPGSHIDTEGRDVEELTRIVMNEITAKR